MVQAPIGTTRVRASGVLSHPLASERGELPLLGPRRAALLHLRRAAHCRWLTLTCTHTHTILLSCSRFSACSPTRSPSRTAFMPLPSLLTHRMIWSTRVCAVSWLCRAECVQRRDAIRAVRQSPTDRFGYVRCVYDGCEYDRQSLRGTSSQAPCPGLGPAEERTHIVS